MKIVSALAGLSLAANAVLLVVLAVGAASGSRVDPLAAERPANSTAASAPSPLTAEAWSKLEAEDLSAHVAQLRREGFPPEVVRAVIAARVHKEFAARRKAIEGDEQPYWIVNRDPKQQAELAALSREESRRLHQLVGPDPEDGTAARIARAMPSLSPEKAGAVAEVRDRANEKRSDIYAATRNASLPEDTAKLNAIEQEARAELVAILSPQELEEYDFRMSTTASRLRNNLVAFDATEAEYRAIFKLQSDLDAKFGNLSPGVSPDVMRARSDAQRAMNEEIKTALGEARYADYQRASDYNYRRTTQLVARLNLPPETANDLYALQQSTQARLNELRRAPTNNPQERFAQISALSAETETTLLTKLGGPAGLEAYKQNGGNWVSNLGPPRPPPPAPKP